MGVLLLDVDGVVSPLCEDTPPRDPDWWATVVHRDAWGFGLWVAPELLDELRRLPDRVRGCWLTTWGPVGVAALCEALDLSGPDTWTVLPTDAAVAAGIPDCGWGKANAVASVLAATGVPGAAGEAGEVVVWVDDHIDRHREEWEEASEGIVGVATPHPGLTLLAHPRLRTVCPPSDRGLDPASWRTVLDALADPGAVSTAPVPA